MSGVVTLRGPGATLTHSNHALHDLRLAAKPVDEAAAAAALQTTTTESSGEGEASAVCAADGGCSSAARLQVMQRALRQVQAPPTQQPMGSSGGCGGATAVATTPSTLEAPTLDVAAAQRILEACPAAHAEYAPTIASVVLEPACGRFHVRFLGEAAWRSFPVADVTGEKTL